MNKIIRQNYPVARLPEDLREGLDPGGVVSVIVETTDIQSDADRIARARAVVDEVWAMRRPPYRSMEEIVAELRAQRDDWDD